MVDDTAQLYTIEGVAAGFLMILTAYFIISSSTVITPQETHIADLQLEQLGSDALRVMDTRTENGTPGYLALCLSNYDPISFSDNITRLINTKTDSGTDRLHYNTTIFYRDGAAIGNATFGGDIYYRENAVKVSRLVTVDHFPPGAGIPSPKQVVLVEVLVWRS